MIHALTILLLVLALLACKESSPQPIDREPAAVVPVTTRAPAERAWYDGGTLHDKGGLDWQKASHANKLATCGDFIAHMHAKGLLKPDLVTGGMRVEHYRPLAEAMVIALDQYFKLDPDPRANRQKFQDQSVATAAVLAMTLAGWVKTEN